MSSQVGKIPNATSSSSNKASKMLSNAKDAVTNIAKGEKGPLIIIVTISVLLLLFVILYITFAMKSSSLKGKQLTNEPVRLDKVEQPVQVGNGDMPKPSVGREYSYCFWLYVENFEQLVDTSNDNEPVDKLVFYRGNAGDIASANPAVLMDGKSNRLYIAIKTQGSSIDSLANGRLHNIIRNNYFINKEIKLDDPLVNRNIILAVDYVPLQRWVHFAVCVDNKIVTIFMDGEIYSVKSVDEYKSSRQPEVDALGKTVDSNLIIDKTDGDIFIGRNASVGNKISIPGYLGRMEFYNYSVSIDDVKKSYDKGPLHSGGLLSWLGINNYGFRSPVYRLDEKQQ